MYTGLQRSEHLALSCSDALNISIFSHKYFCCESDDITRHGQLWLGGREVVPLPEVAGLIPGPHSPYLEVSLSKSLKPMLLLVVMLAASIAAAVIGL